MCEGWESSAEAWITDMGDRGDFSREFVLDGPMMARVRQARPRTALDLGCGEGRFCRMMAGEGIAVTGLEPTARLLSEARERDGSGAYVAGFAEKTPFEDAAFDMVVAYMTLIDIEGLDAALDEVVRVLRPGGRFLIANLSGYATALPAGKRSGWLPDASGREAVFACDDYHTPRGLWVTWRGISVRNYHRPLETYMTALLSRGLRLSHFAEPAPTGGPARKAELYGRAPMFVLMEWEKPAA